MRPRIHATGSSARAFLIPLAALQQRRWTSCCDTNVPNRTGCSGAAAMHILLRHKSHGGRHGRTALSHSSLVLHSALVEAAHWSHVLLVEAARWSQVAQLRRIRCHSNTAAHVMTWHAIGNADSVSSVGQHHAARLRFRMQNSVGQHHAVTLFLSHRSSCQCDGP